MVDLNAKNFITIGLIAMIFAWSAKFALAKIGVKNPIAS